MLAKRCPQCGTSKVRLAPRRTLLDRIFRAFTIYPLRCQLCTYRFRSFLGRPSANPRRSYERVAVQYPVWFQSSFTRASEGLGYPGTITNLSIRGCRVRSATPIPKGASLRLEFQPSPYDLPITIDGAVVRSQAGNAVGLRFVTVCRDEERRLRHLLEPRLSGSRFDERRH
ncbi:MAG: PilZ domain-containing protein [Nitrospirota bacterium]